MSEDDLDSDYDKGFDSGVEDSTIRLRRYLSIKDSSVDPWKVLLDKPPPRKVNFQPDLTVHVSRGICYISGYAFIWGQGNLKPSDFRSTSQIPLIGWEEKAPAHLCDLRSIITHVGILVEAQVRGREVATLPWTLMNSVATANFVEIDNVTTLRDITLTK